jgi:hypothetical protein
VFNINDLSPTIFLSSSFCIRKFGSFTVNCFQTDLVTNTLRLQNHTAMFGIAYKFNFARNQLSVSGPKRKCRPVSPMSALPPLRADILQRCRHARFVP